MHAFYLRYLFETYNFIIQCVFRIIEYTKTKSLNIKATLNLASKFEKASPFGYPIITFLSKMDIVMDKDNKVDMHIQSVNTFFLFK